ncbi:MAG: dihydropteroate synthase [Armatimonadota bacterium]|nr:dihydropteroate synthase [Armatimonadota bacterium]
MKRFELPTERAAVMGVLNVTPDSFSDGGEFLSPQAAIEHGIALAEEGADIVDVGGESTRPGAEPVSIDHELARVIPVIEALVREEIAVSIDTMKPNVARAAVAGGASVINDVNGLRAPGMLQVIAETDASVCIMHMLGEPRSMQVDPHYDDVVTEVLDWLLARADEAIAAGIARENIWIDPGIGFGKTVDHNLSLLKTTAEFASTGFPVLVGASRKSFIGKIADEDQPQNRMPGSLAAALYAVSKGARIVRVHDVAASVQALAIQQAISEAD